MTTTAIILITLLATAVGAVCGYVIGRDTGIQYGKDAQFVDDFINGYVKRRQFKRDRAGRFAA